MMTPMTPEQIVAKIREMEEERQAEQVLRDQIEWAGEEDVDLPVPMEHFTSMQKRHWK